MKLRTLAALFAGIAFSAAAAAQTAVAPNGLPKDYQEFKARYQREATTPEGALRMHMQAVFAYLNPALREDADRPYEGDGYLKIPLRSSGADNARPIWLRQHDGLWYVENNAGLYVMVREPTAHADARRNAHDADYD